MTTEELIALPLLRTGKVQVRDFTLAEMQAYAIVNIEADRAQRQAGQEACGHEVYQGVCIKCKAPFSQLAPPPAQVPEGYTLVAVKGFSDLMYWLDRCDNKGHLENCSDLIEPWAAFDYREL